ncbi:transcriptional adapter 3-B [Cylas formicarius]|uniref:transcriptional adapter 3-B n=1 Tax=Cylas formicarius TaxID=197179 RepID=UPI00295885FB|nr:transcriptional adapter 3-B [Cylas formicarius]
MFFENFKNVGSNGKIGHSKRAIANQKNHKLNGKLLSHHKSEPKLPDVKDFASIPIVKQADNARLLPKYAAILGKTKEEAVGMDDLNQLQHDLEKLLSTAAVRQRFFLGEIKPSEKSEHEKRAHDKTSFKRKRPYKKPSLPKNDNSVKFWTSTEPYCAPVSKNDVAYLDTLIQEFSKEIDYEIPEMGEHYANTWSEELINEEQNLGKSPNKKVCTVDLKKNRLHSMVAAFWAPQIQSIPSALIQEIGDNGLKVNKTKSLDFSKFKQNLVIGACLNRALKLEEVPECTPKDEIYAEIKKCQQELSTINKYNVEELNKLRSLVFNDIHCNDLKEELDKVDRRVLDLYNNIIATRKKALEEEGKEFDEDMFCKQILNEFGSKADALLKQQVVLNREINSLTDMSMLY